MSDRKPGSSTRREFVKTATMGAAAAFVAPTIVTAKKTDGQLITGAGEHQYEILPDWPQLPDRYTWQTTHNVAIDSEGLVYVIHEGQIDQPDHPAIFVFDPDGKFVRAFGAEFHAGGHGIEVRNESGQDFLYVSAFQQQRSFAKLDTKGEIVWRKGAPMDTGFFAAGEDRFPRDAEDNPWGRDRFMPTNVAFLPDGGFALADGYGSWRIFRYDADAELVATFGEPAGNGRADGTFLLPHGIWLDDRGGEPLLAVADRALNRMQWFTIDGEHRRTQDGFLLPANADTRGDLMVVPELIGRVTLLDSQNRVAAHLGDNSEQMKADPEHEIRLNPSRWVDGKFLHPHDACFDADGNLFVVEWVRGGRVTKLRRLS